MRLIDADELVDILIVNRYYPFGVSIDKVPTVDAIPIQWIKNYARKICDDDGGRYNSKAYGIDRMIYDWEKENARNNSEV